MSFPNVGEKHRLNPVITSEQDLRTNYGGRIPRVPRKAVLVYDSDLEDALLMNGGLRLSKRFKHLLASRVYLARSRDTVLVRLAIGAPITALVVENLITMGAREFLIIGTAGGLKRPRPGDLFLCTRALRDEGTSHHYIPDSPFAEPDPELSRTLSRAMKEGNLVFRSAPSWTIDAPYTESVEELNRYSKEGIMTVEMEAAALFAVAKAKGVKAAAVFMVSDVLSERGWSGFVRGTKPEHFGSLVEVFGIFDRLRI